LESVSHWFGSGGHTTGTLSGAQLTYLTTVLIYCSPHE
jgi:hypothetical protein